MRLREESGSTDWEVKRGLMYGIILLLDSMCPRLFFFLFCFKGRGRGVLSEAREEEEMEKQEEIHTRSTDGLRFGIRAPVVCMLVRDGHFTFEVNVQKQVFNSGSHSNCGGSSSSSSDG